MWVEQREVEADDECSHPEWRVSRGRSETATSGWTHPRLAKTYVSREPTGGFPHIHRLVGGQKPRARQQACNKQQTRDHACVRACGCSEPDRWVAEEVVEHNGMDDSSEGRACGDYRHRKSAPSLKVVRDHGEGGNVEHPLAEA